MKNRVLYTMLLLAMAIVAQAEEITYKIVRYNADAQDFVIRAYGKKPVGAAAWFENEYGATTGNRYNQIPRNRTASLKVEGLDNCVVKSITLSMCSNNKAGSFGIEIADEQNSLAKFPVRDFADQQWYGRWVSKDLGVYVDIRKDIANQTAVSGLLDICIKGGTSEGSVYLNAVTIEYDAPSNVKLESPLGYVFEKLAAKSTISEGDVLMMYRSGDAAGDIDGMEKSQYLDAIGIASTSDVCELDVEYFTATKDATGKCWLLTDQYGRRLGAGSKKLLWDSGELAWNISIGYDGATIASANADYGTMRYNTPVESYPRFGLYTSKTLTLPYLYRRVRQNEPVVSTAIKLGEAERTVNLSEQDTVVVKSKLVPDATTDFRILWNSSNEAVAKVSDGIVTLLSEGDATITATAHDSGVQSSMLLHVVGSPSAILTPSHTDASLSERTYNLQGIAARGKGIVVRKNKKFIK